MINIKRLTENLQVMKNNVLLEDTFRSLKDQVDSSRQRSITNAEFIGIDQANDGAARTHWKVPSESKPGKSYESIVEVVVPTKGGLFAIAAGPWNMKAHADALAKSNVRVHCTCPDFYWSGMKYNLGPGGPHKGTLAHDQKSGVPEETYPIKPPNIRDPDRKNVMCKHLSKVWRAFATRGTTIMSQARKYANEHDVIETDPKITRDSDDGKATLDKNIEGVSVTEGDAQQITDSLFTAAEELHKGQDTGSEDIMDERNEDVIDNIADDTDNINDVDSTDEFNDQEPEDIIDDENQEVSELDTTEAEEIQDQGVEDIIDDQNTVVTDDKSEIDVSTILDDPESDEESEKNDDDEEYSAKDILSR